MRLTLRTLLAYLDEVLDPEDTEELSAKIGESDFASGLVHRIRNSVGRLRLSCPSPLAKGLAVDANSVGEYIDSTLPEDRLADFERACLESDMHLAEVSACHQIVTWIVREPADVDPGMRERIRELGAEKYSQSTGGYRRVDEALASLDDDGNDAGNDGQAKVASAIKPDYMTAGRRRKRVTPWIVTAVLAGFLLTVSFLIATASKDKQQISELPSLSTQTQPAPAVDANEFELAVPDLTAASDLATSDSTMVDRGSDFIESSTPAGAAVLDPSTAASELPLPEPTGDVGLSESSMPANGDSDTGDLAASDAGVGAADAGELTAAEAPLVDTDEASTVGEPTDVGQPLADTASEPGVTDETVPAELAADEAEPVDAGRFISDREVLAFWNEETAVWGRVPPRGQLAVGTHYRVPIAFRPQLLLGDGIQMTIAGRSELLLEEPASGHSPLIRFGYGRAVFATLGQDGNHVFLVAGNQPVQITFGDAEAEFAVEVTKQLAAGSDPLTGQRQQVVRVWATSGRVGVSASGEETRAVEGGQQWTSINGQPGELIQIEATPAWIESAQLRDIDRTALMKIEPMLDVDRPLTLSLSEAAESRRQEVRALAARCLASLERFEPLTASLSDPKQHPAWMYQFRELQSALARNPETAQRVWDALRTTSGQDADELFRMLWGYSQAQLDGGVVSQLLDHMEGASLPHRVLAFQNIHATTKKTLYYRPEQPSARRKESATQWRRQLASGQVVCQEPAPISATE